MNIHELELLVRVYINNQDGNNVLVVPESISSQTIESLIRHRCAKNYYAEYRAISITDKGKALVDGILKSLEPPTTGIKTPMEILYEFEKEMGLDKEDFPTLETQGKKLEEIRSMNKKYILKKDLPIGKAGTGIDRLRSSSGTETLSFIQIGKAKCELPDWVSIWDWIEEATPREFEITI